VPCRADVFLSLLSCCSPEIKEVKLRPVTEKADYETKVKQAQKFLSKGAKVKLTMTFSGREMRFKHQGKDMMLVSSLVWVCRLSFCEGCCS
jgi:translation initiation factor IF-3